ncbi:MAG: T9SS type A sorting domain-containing protein [Melioribacteraceae bacterium]|nr:T9SS type A sorting domain-containing protein [Melioribacteraceae bacterium]
MKKTILIILIMLITFIVSLAQTSEFFDKVNYKGAFGSSNWMKGWTALDHYSYLAANKVSANTVTVTDADINSGDQIYWTANNTYILDGFVYVEDAAVLNIEAGTVIKGKAGQGESASALIITKGAKIFAEGTADSPIIFTAESDDVNNPADLILPATNLWGGIIILGKAQINTSAGIGNIEGIPVESRTEYGGTDDNDNSGVLRYVSIRHGGTDIGSGKEINGLTLGGVGRGTTIDYVEVFQNNDDGFEWFGGTVNAKHLVSAFNADDAFDHDEGLRGKMQFLFVIQDVDFGNRTGEHDGGTDPEDGTPFAYPNTYNATFLGSGMSSTNPDNDYAFKIRDNWGGSYKNSIFGDFAGIAMDIEDLESGQDAKQRLDDGEIIFENNIWFKFGGGSDFNALGKHDYESAYLNNANNGNTIEDPQLAGISRDAYAESLDPTVTGGSAAYNNLAEYPAGDDFFDIVNYKGAFGQTNWMKGWTALDHYGYISTGKTSANIISVVDSDINSGDQIYWTVDNTYILDGFVYVEDGAVLNIEAGTIIKGKAGQGESASALIITKGAKLFAEGTGVNPIIFTAESDDVTDPTDLVLPATNLWGGLIILGNAQINTSSGVGNIEGIPVEPRTEYGGTNDNDGSGVLRYISIRHGGTDIGSGKEINGITLGGVGYGTTLDHIEVFQNNDDGFEWFGGKPKGKYLVSAFNADDAFDHDEGLRSFMQFLFVIQDADFGNRVGEHDGGTDPEDGTPFAFPQSYNVTYLGSGINSTNPDNDYVFKIRDNWGGSYKNSIFGDFAGIAMDIEDLASGQDSKQRLDDGEIIFENNIWFNFGGGSDFNTLGKHDHESAYLNDASNGNRIENPQLAGISREPYSEGIDPRPIAGGVAYQNIGDYVTSVKRISGVDIVSDYQLSQNYPNPFNPSTKIQFSVPKQSMVSLTVYNILGQKISTLVSDVKTAGSYELNFNASKLSSGVYIYRLESENNSITKKMTLLK